MSSPKENQTMWYGLDLVATNEAREAVEYALMEAGASGNGNQRRGPVELVSSDWLFRTNA